MHRHTLNLHYGIKTSVKEGKEMKNKDPRKHQVFCDSENKKYFGHLCDTCLRSRNCKEGVAKIIIRCEKYRKRGVKSVHL